MNNGERYCCWELPDEQSHVYNSYCDCCTGWCKTCAYPIGYKLIESREIK